MRKYRIASGVALLVGSLIASLPAGAQTVEVTPTDLNGWTFHESNATGTSAITASQPRNGDGSLELNTTDGSGRTRFGNSSPYNPAAPTIAQLDEVTSLGFDWFRDAVSTADAWHAPAFRLHIWDGAQRSELIWEAVYNGYPTAGAGVPEGTWMTTDLMSSVFYRYVAGAGVTLVGGSQVNQSIAAWGSSSLYSADARITGMSIGAGSGWQNGTFTGHADNVVFGADGREVTYNFEVTGSPTVTPEPMSMVLLGTGLAGLGLARGRRRKKVSEVA